MLILRRYLRCIAISIGSAEMYPALRLRMKVIEHHLYELSAARVFRRRIADNRT